MKKKLSVMGAPCKYKPEYCELLKEHMGAGYSFETFAATIDVSKDTLYQWAKDFPDFSDAFDKSRVKCQMYWEKTGINGVNGKIRHFNGAVWAFWMKNRFQWHDNVKLEQTVVSDESEEVKAMADKLVKLKNVLDESND